MTPASEIRLLALDVDRTLAASRTCGPSIAADRTHPETVVKQVHQLTERCDEDGFVAVMDRILGK